MTGSISIHAVPKDKYKAYGLAVVEPYTSKWKTPANKSDRFIKANRHLPDEQLQAIISSNFDESGRRKWPQNGNPVLSGLQVHDRGSVSVDGKMLLAYHATCLEFGTPFKKGTEASHTTYGGPKMTGHDVNPNDIVFEDHDFNKDRDKYCHKFFRERGEAHFAKSGKFATREEAAAFDRESYELNLPSCMKSLHAPSDMPCTMNIWFWQEGEAWANEQPPKVARPRKKQKTQ